MKYSQFTYPKYETPLLQAYSGRFSAAFVALHPFFRMPASANWKAVDSDTNYPNNPYIRQYGQPVHWLTIMQAIECKDLRRFYIGMRTSVAALKQEYEDREVARLIDKYTKQENIYHPTEGMIEPLLIEPISRYISHEQSDVIFYLPELEEEPEVLSAEAAVQKCDENSLRGSLFDMDVTRLATVDWDDFFTVIYGSSSELASLLERTPLEGFFCDDQTLHGWCWQSNPIKLSV